MVNIPKNTYTIEADKDVERVVGWVVKHLNESEIYIKNSAFDETIITDGRCETSEAVAMEAARHMIKAGYHASIYHYELTGCFGWLKISRKNISGSYHERVLG